VWNKTAWGAKAMSGVWKTKYGYRKVKEAAPELKEAIEAARDISDDPAAQAEIAAALMGMPVEDVKKEVMRSVAQRKMTERVSTISRGGTRPAVVVERNTRRRVRVFDV
jgi:hypothetical protein